MYEQQTWVPPGLAVRLNALVWKPVRFRVEIFLWEFMFFMNGRTISSSRFLSHIHLQCSMP